ncbi:hypothetical protein [Staphylococcus hominis]|uniref:hypothetical protein n=1 Tax=Staphylococcus hominis TaxID=1290 RepID=UPI001F5693FE|nr:hypothetical protein [Staphylococcus hominis]MCI2848326.1 hypothetical protein [Staphylococcus hominis]MCI2849729.1 hypothetical protein [Staphylococcus hominis]MCI2855864.1 hypothetical protein [Staphylococcus hominis]
MRASLIHCLASLIEWRFFEYMYKIKKVSVITYTDLMTDKEVEIWNELNAAERAGIILSFNLMLVKNGVDRRIVPSVKLGNDRIYVN